MVFILFDALLTKIISIGFNVVKTGTGPEKGGSQMTEQICPTCGCRIGVNPAKKENVLYCCHACAEGGQCECGCCEESDLPPPEG